MEDSEIARFIGKFEAKLEAMEATVERLETCVEKLAHAMSSQKPGWQLLLSIGFIFSLIGSSLHKPIQSVVDFFK